MKGEGRDWHCVLHSSQPAHCLEGWPITLAVIKKKFVSHNIEIRYGCWYGCVGLALGIWAVHAMWDKLILCHYFWRAGPRIWFSLAMLLHKFHSPKLGQTVSQNYSGNGNFLVICLSAPQTLCSCSLISTYVVIPAPFCLCELTS